MPRSGRCAACKASKVKCDEGVPQCQRCIKAGKPCPGYPDVTKLAFRDMTSVAEKKVESRVQKVLGARAQAESDLAKTSAIPGWREDAIAQFFADWSVESEAVPYTTVVFPELCDSPDAGVCLKDALNAAAFAHQANKLSMPWMAVQASTAYGLALASLTKALQDPGEVLKDTTLAATFLIGLYELIIGYLPTGALMDHHHHQGRMQLLRLRNSYQFNSSTGRCLFEVVHEQALLKCLTRHDQPLEEAGDWIQRSGVRGPPQQVAIFNIYTAQICAEAQILFNNSEQNRDWELRLMKIIEDVRILDLQYQAWIDKHSASKLWRYRTFCLPPDEAVPADGIVQVYHDSWVAYIWTSCRSKRAHLHEVFLHCLALLGCHPGAKNLSSKLKNLSFDRNPLTRSKRIIDEMVTGTCATVPFVLGDVDSDGKLAMKRKRTAIFGYKLLWPLHVARASSEVGGERDTWIRGRYAFIDSEMGIRFSGLMANKVIKEPWDLS